MSIQNIPAEMQARKNFLVWKTEERSGRLTKIPYDANKNGEHEYAKTNNADTWATFARAVEVSDPLSGTDYEGVGFVFTDTDFVGVDLDGVVHDGVIDPIALAILKIANTYCEFSPSLTGVHFIFETTIPLPVGNRKGNKKLGGEIYNKTSPRYFTCSGNTIDGFPKNITKIDDPGKIALLHFLVLNLLDAKLTRLWVGDISGYPSHSEADLALCGMLARKGGFNTAKKVDAAFRQSGLMRPEWNHKSKYTLAKVLDGQPKEPTNIQSSGHEIVFRTPATGLGSAFDYVLGPDPKKTGSEGWFPLGDVSALVGASGTGKTTWMNQLLRAQLGKVTFYGRETFGRPFITLGADRGMNAVIRTMQRMRMRIESTNFVPMPIDVFDFKAAQAIADKIESRVLSGEPCPEIVFVEGMDTMLTNSKDPACVSSFLRHVQAIAQHFHLAIVGSIGSPKLKQDNGYAATRDNISGSAMFGRVLETIVLMQFSKKKIKGRRLMTVEARNGTESDEFTLKFVDGLLEIEAYNHDDDADNEKSNDGRSSRLSKQTAAEVEWFQEMARSENRWFTVQDLEEKFGISRASANNHVNNALAKGFIVLKPGKKVGRGGTALHRWNDNPVSNEWIKNSESELSI
jgi:ABC-type oligopeptide transport system ATPase subunit